MIAQKNSLPSSGSTDLGWPVMRRLLTGRGGWAGGSERSTGASSQTQRQASDLKDNMDAAGYSHVTHTSVFMGTKHLFAHTREK